MYDDHYGLTGRPFQLTPDPAFWYDTATHRKAMAYLGYGLAQGEGFIVITGDPGAGKTTLVGHLMATIDPDRLNVIRLVTTQVDPDDLLRLVAGGLGVDHARLTKAQLLSAIERGLHAVARSGRRTLLIVDEAQSLPVAAIEELRMLSNFQAGGYALLQIFLLGQPEFRERLHGSDRLEQLRQRVIAMHHLEPMEAEEVGPYLAHRLRIAGSNGTPTFSARAIAAMHRWSGGVPRRLNQLASRVLLYGAIDGIDRFKGSDIERVIEDLDGDGLGTPAGSNPVAASRSQARDEFADAIEYVPVADMAPKFDAERQAAVVEEEEAPVVSQRGEGDAVASDTHAYEEAEAEPLPMTPPPPPMPPRPLHLSVVANDPVIDLPDAPERDDAVEWNEDESEIAEDEAPPTANELLLADRIGMLEARLEEQDEALRRVLTLLVDWVEGDRQRPDLDTMRQRA